MVMNLTTSFGVSVYLPNKNSACAMGKDRAGWVYTIQAVEGMRTIRRKPARLVLETGLSTADLELLMQRIELSQFNVFV